MMADDWQEAWSMTACEQCGRTKRCQLLSDPFLSEVYQEDTAAEWWCYDCWDVRKGDV